MTDTITGTISTTGTGYGFVSHPDQEKDIFIDTPNLNHALNGDTVEVEILGEADNNRLAGKVVRIVEEGKRKFVGVLDKGGETWFLKTDDQKMYVDIFLGTGKEGFAQDVKVYAEITSWEEGKKNPSGKVIEILGSKNTHEVEMRAIILERGIEADFPPQVEEEAEKLLKNHSIEEGLKDPKRRDLRDLPTFTIDPDTAKDFDDALSFRELENETYEIGVHIADVAHFVQPGTELDREARNRAFSTYLVDRTIPMLPEILSNDLCSLNPNEDKFAFSAVFVVNKSGDVEERWFGRSVIHSNHRFTYEDAQAVIDAGTGEHFEALFTLNTLAKIIRHKRFLNGAIEFSTDEVKFQLDDDGRPIGVHVKEHLDTHALIEEFMLLANQEVALETERLAKKRGAELPLVYRIHDEPDREKLEELSAFVHALGYDFKVPKGEITGELINRLIKEAEERPEEGLINTTMIRSMAKAHYSMKNIGHFGLAFDYYAHFTSPIRRYPDLLVHRLFFKHLHNESVPKQQWASIEAAAKHASEQEVTVMQAERESIKFKQVEYLMGKIGEIFEGVVTGVNKHGLFVEEQMTRAQGFVSVRTMDDYFTLDEKNYALIGQKSGQVHRLGDERKIKLTGADLDKRQLDFQIVK